MERLRRSGAGAGRARDLAPKRPSRASSACAADNAAAARLYGYTADELRGMFNHQLSAEPEATQRVSRLTPADVGGVVVIPLRLHRRRDGTVIPVELSVRFFELGGLRVHISAIRDIGTR
ncbi:MAG: PAS domain S-box protein, partial [Betaproteobacteria bacterium]|nr:PAS domain S-box protein [Betaproteobacteria bacterium]